MKIESLIRRAGGTRVTLDDTAYHFRPTEQDERHTADVSVPAHVKRFLAIPEGYQPAELSELGTVNQNPTGQQQTLAPSKDEDIPLDKMNQKELKALAKEVEIEGYDDMKRDALIKAIKKATGEAEAEDDDNDGDDDQSNGGQGGDGDDTNRNPVTDSTGGAGTNGAADTNGDGGQGDSSKDGAKPLAELSHDELVAAYKAKFNGKAPHHKLSDERIKQILAEEDE